MTETTTIIVHGGLPQHVVVKVPPPKLELEVARKAAVVNFACGCYCEYPTIGTFAGLGWHIMPCFKHANRREDIEAALLRECA